ncbi:MAG: PqqD family peptide modification chaperone [Syntrophomonas sp.]
MTISNKPELKKSLVIREEFDDYAILFDPDTSLACAINPVSVFICRQLNGQRTVDEIVDGIRQTFTEVPDELKEDVQSFLDDLADRQMLQ